MGLKMMLRARVSLASWAAWWGSGGGVAGGAVGCVVAGGGGFQGCWPRARPWAMAWPFWSMRVMDQRVLGCREAAAAIVRVSSGSRRPKLPAWAGVVDQPRRVPMGMVRLRLAGGGAGGGWGGGWWVGGGGGGVGGGRGGPGCRVGWGGS